MIKDKRYDALINVLKGYGSVAIAFSGGADSSLLAHAAHHALDELAMAIHISSQTVPEQDSIDAVKISEEIGIKMITLDVDLLEEVGFNTNPPDRCGICKARLMNEVLEQAKRSGLTVVADGAIMDDLSDYRPGHAVADELGIKHPLIDADLSKTDVMDLLSEIDLSTAGKQPSPCLASRIPYGQAINASKLAVIDRVERKVKGMGFRVVRVRLHESINGRYIGILEVEDVSRALVLWDDLIADEPDITLLLDPRGYRMGSMNEGLTSP